MAAAAAVGGGGGRRGQLPQTAAMMNLLTDMAFNLLIFFVVCASTEPKQGRTQQIPGAAAEQAAQPQAAQNVEVAITRTTVTLNGADVAEGELVGKLRPLLAGKTKPDERVVVVRNAKDTPYRRWIAVTGLVEKAGGLVTLQVEEEREVGVR